MRKTILGSPLFSFDSVESTNDIAKKLALKGFNEGTSVIADNQTKGRGRFGRQWQSPDGENIYLSIVLKPKEASSIPFLSLLGAASVAKTVKGFYNGSIEIKWPNDVLVKGKKMAGILNEAKLSGKKVKHLIMGIGINLNSKLTSLDASLAKKTMSLSLAKGKDINKEAFLKRLFINLTDFYGQFKKGKRKALLDLTNKILYKKNKRIEFLSDKNVIETKLLKVNRDGSLRLSHKDSCFDVFTGEIIR